MGILEDFTASAYASIAMVNQKILKPTGKACASAFNTTVRLGAKSSKRGMKEGVDFFRYKKWIRSGPEKYISPKKRQIMREIYFQQCGYDVAIPKESDGRLELAHKCISKIPPDFQAPII